jgi:hypothetical protein
MPGQKYGELEVIEESPEKVRKEKAYICRCSCGETTVATKSQLQTGRKKSCGCLRKRTPPNALDLTGQRFGDLEVIERAGTNERGQALWLCRCLRCGNLRPFAATTLRRGEAVSCGCIRPEQIRRANAVLRTDMSVDGVQIPILTKKVRSDSGTGIKGVYRRVRKDVVYYEAHISVKGKRVWGPMRRTLAEAIADRKALEAKYHKPYIEKLESGRMEDTND